MKCDRCKKQFKVDIFVPYQFWQEIKPLKEGKGGYLCPACIIDAVEKAGVIVAGLDSFITRADLEKLSIKKLSRVVQTGRKDKA